MRQREQDFQAYVIAHGYTYRPPLRRTDVEEIRKHLSFENHDGAATLDIGRPLNPQEVEALFAMMMERKVYNIFRREFLNEWVPLLEAAGFPNFVQKLEKFMREVIELLGIVEQTNSRPGHWGLRTAEGRIVSFEGHRHQGSEHYAGITHALIGPATWYGQSKLIGAEGETVVFSEGGRSLRWTGNVDQATLHGPPLWDGPRLILFFSWEIEGL